MATIRYMLSVSAPAERAFKAWADFRGLEKHFAFAQSVEHKEGHWELEYKGIFRTSKVVLQHTELIDSMLVAFKSCEGVPLAGSVAFDAAGAKTYVTFVLSFDPPANRIGDIVSEAFGFPGIQLEEGLKKWAEALEKS